MSDPLLDLWNGEHVRLRMPRRDDLPQVSAWNEDPRMSWFGDAGPPYPGQRKDRWEEFADDPNGPGHSRFVITELHDDIAIGTCGLQGYSLQQPTGWLSIEISSAYWGKGVGTDAVRVLCRYGFDGLGLHRIRLGTFGFNERGAAAYRKVGFVEEGRLRDMWFRGGEWHDDIAMGLLASEWRAAQEADS